MLIDVLNNFLHKSHSDSFKVKTIGLIGLENFSKSAHCIKVLTFPHKLWIVSAWRLAITNAVAVVMK
ncbi:hypothetical protein PO909_015975 [Leuciscus waleckii]